MEAENNTAAVNEVDVSEERIQREIEAALSGAGVNLDEPDTPDAATDTAPDADAEQAAASLAGYLGFAFLTAGQWLAPAWQITREQYAQLASVWSRVVVKYLPASWLRFIPSNTGGGACEECDALAVTVGVILPNLGTPRHVQEIQKQPEARPETAPETRPETPPQPDAMLDVNELGRAHG